MDTPGNRHGWNGFADHQQFDIKSCGRTRPTEHSADVVVAAAPSHALTRLPEKHGKNHARVVVQPAQFR